MTATKKFCLPKEEIKELVQGLGGCIATDRITVDGRPVGFMYREEADNNLDSGWRFMAGDESEDYMDDADHHGIYDVNTIANYDPAIIPHLNAPIGSQFGRDEETNEFFVLEDECQCGHEH